MPIISDSRRLERVEYIRGHSSGVFDFAVDGENEEYTWWGRESAEWTIEDVASIEHERRDEDRFLITPAEEYFVCEIAANGEEGNEGPIHCWCE